MDLKWRWYWHSGYWHIRHIPAALDRRHMVSGSRGWYHSPGIGALSILPITFSLPHRQNTGGSCNLFFFLQLFSAVSNREALQK